MGDKSSIEWTDATWNPVTGCDRVSPGCAHCYALDLAARLKRMGQKRYQKDGDPKTSGPGFGLTLHPDKLDEPLRWTKPRMIFVNSMSDLFHEEIPDDYIIEVFNTMGKATRHTFQVLTKRPERMVELVEDVYEKLGFPSPLPNVWLGVSIENRRFVYRADLLRQTPAAVRFISAEPLLGPLIPTARSEADWGHLWLDPGGPVVDETRPALDLTDVDWLIVGGESGPLHRPMDVQWVRDLRDACEVACDCTMPIHEGVGNHWPDCACLGGTAFFLKQWGGLKPKSGGRELDGRTWDEMPDRQAVPLRV